MRPSENEAVGSLIGRLVADGQAYARAEVDLYKHKALAWVPPVRTAAILVVVALFIAQASITTFLVGIGFWLALWLGPIGGTLAAAVIGLLVAGLLAYLAVKKLKVGGAA